MKSMAQLFDVCVRGFPESLNWCLGYDEKKGEITSRGRISDKPPTDKGEGTCYSKDWVKGANKLLPPEKICPS